MRKLEQARGSAQRNPYYRGYDVNPIDFTYFSSHEDFDDEEWGPIRIRHQRDDLKDLKVEALKFDENLNLKNYLDWVQAIERIFEFKEYNDEKSFKFTIIKLKGHASLWYEHLKKSRASEGKSKFKTWSKLKKYMDKRFLPPLQSRTLPQYYLSQPRESNGERVH